MTDERVIRNRLALLPPIRRARLWRLYAEDSSDGRPGRFLDLWMDGGRSILGAKGSGIGTAAKAGIDTGLTRPFPSVREARLEKALLARYPDYASVRLFRNEERALSATRSILGDTELAVLRPFAEHLRDRPESGAAIPPIAMPLLPCPAALAPAALLFKNPADAEPILGDIVPPLLLSCAHRALSELDRFAQTYDEGLWKRVDRRLKDFFDRSGPYLYPRVGNDAYDAFFTAALGAGVLVSPDPELPAIIPGDFDDGELAALAVALAAAFGELGAKAAAESESPARQE
jgi:hypothetical protein